MKKNQWKIFASISAVLFCIGICVIGYALSPYHPRNVTDEAVIRNGTEYTVRLSGVSEYDENGFRLAAQDFYFSSEDIGVVVDEDGFVRSDYENETDIRIDGRYSSAFVKYEDYSFCGESYKNRGELESFFETPDRIYNFDINELSGYIQDIINYEKKFKGEATVKIYRERCVITEVYIGEEKILVHKGIV